MTAIATGTRYVYDFAEGSRDMRVLLGGKGANIAEMTRVLGPDLVPAGFTITTEACVAFMHAGRAEPAGLAEQVAEGVARLEERTGRALGDPDDPLLVSVRSGARDSMPGMLESILDLGLNDESVLGLAAHAATSASRGTPTGASCRCSATSCAASRASATRRSSPRPGSAPACARTGSSTSPRCASSRAASARSTRSTPASRSRRIRRSSCASPSAPSSTPGWATARSHYRRINHIPDDWGTAVNVQQMVFGNRGSGSATGVAFSRDELTGAPEPSGDFLLDAQGEDVVSGVRTPRPLHELAERPARGPRRAAAHPAHARGPLRRHAGRRVHRRARPPLHAADARRQAPGPGRGPLRRRRRRRGPAHARAGARHDRRRRARRAAAPDLRPGGALRGARPRRRRLARARPRARSSSPPRRRSPRPRRPATSSSCARSPRPTTSPASTPRAGILTSEGGKASHAALVARGMGRPAVVGAGELEVDLRARTVRVGDVVIARRRSGSPSTAAPAW